jgi:hypothetical protein
MHNVEASVMSFPMRNHTNTTHIASTGHHGDDTSVEADVICYLAGCDVDFDGVIDADNWVWVTDAR